MNLFEIIPENLFSILNSKNKNIYISSLFVIRNAFKQELIIDKDVLVEKLKVDLAKELIELDLEEENESDMKQIHKDAASLASFVVRKFKETGWIEPEYGVDTKFKEFVALPPYSVKLINVLYAIIKEDEQGYNTYMYSIYSNLIQANTERQDFMYAALVNAYEKTSELENDLKTLFHNIRRKYNKLTYLNSVHDVLVDHFDEYQKKIIKQIYMPLKTKDSLNRFKGNIIKILLSWLREKETIESIEKQALTFRNFATIDEARDDIISKIYFIVDKLNELEEMIDKIDKKNQDYVSATTEKMSFLINKDTSVRAKVSKILDALNLDVPEHEENMDVLNENIYLEKCFYIDESSLFIRSIPKTIFDNEPMELDIYDSDEVDQIANSFIDGMNERLSTKRINEYVGELLEDKNELNSLNLDIKNDEELILTIYSMIKGWDKNIFYKIDLKEGNIKNNNYSIPDMDYIRRRKI